jgi:hypothetical protein
MMEVIQVMSDLQLPPSGWDKFKQGCVELRENRLDSMDTSRLSCHGPEDVLELEVGLTALKLPCLFPELAEMPSAAVAEHSDDSLVSP